MSVSTTASAPARAVPNSASSSFVREKRWAGTPRTSRLPALARAAATTAAISVGWWPYSRRRESLRRPPHRAPGIRRSAPRNSASAPARTPKGSPSSNPTASAASALSRLWRPGTFLQPQLAQHPLRRRGTRREVARADDATGAQRLEHDVLRTQVPRRRRLDAVGHDAPRDAGPERGKMPIVAADDDGPVEGDLVRELGECVQHPIERPVVVEVLAVEVGDNRDHWREPEEGAVALVRLDDHVSFAGRDGHCCRRR